MYRTRQQFPSFMGVYIPPCSNVQSSINICVCYITTVCTMKVLAIADTDVTALVTCLRGVCRRDGDNLNASQLAFVFEERSELIEIPRVASPSERFVTFLGVHTPNGYFSNPQWQCLCVLPLPLQRVVCLYDGSQWWQIFSHVLSTVSATYGSCECLWTG